FSFNKIKNNNIKKIRMAVVFTNAGELRRGGKNNLMRFGPKIGLSVFNREKIAEKKTPNQLAAGKLVTALEKYGIIEKQERYAFRDEMVQLEQLRFMNMPMLAAALILIRVGNINSSKSLTPQKFQEAAEYILPNVL